MIYILVLLNLFFSIPQEKKVSQSSDFITTDPLGNLYCVDNTTIVMYNKEGKRLCEYTNSFLGQIHNVDASDPLRIMLHFGDFNQILFLDRSLSQIGDPLDLYKYSSNETTLACSSSQGGFWIFNPEDMQVFHISSQGRILTQSILLNSIPSSIVEKNHKLYLLIPKEAIVILDDQGQYLKKIAIEGIENFQIHHNSIIYSKQNRLFKYSPLQKEDTPLFPSLKNIPPHNRVEEGVLFYSDGSHIYIHHPTP